MTGSAVLRCCSASTTFHLLTFILSRRLMRAYPPGHDHAAMQPRRGLQPRQNSRGRAAVLGVDVISDFAFPDGRRVRRALQSRASAIRHLLERARSHRVPVIYANDNVGPWRSDSSSLIARCIEPARDGAQLVRSLVPAAQDSIILKPRHSAFFGTRCCDAHTRGLGRFVRSGGHHRGCFGFRTARDREKPASSTGGAHPRAGSALRFARGKILNGE